MRHFQPGEGPSIRRFQPGEGPSKGLLRDCEIFANIRIAFVLSSRHYTQAVCDVLLWLWLAVRSPELPQLDIYKNPSPLYMQPSF